MTVQVMKMMGETETVLVQDALQKITFHGWTVRTRWMPLSQEDEARLPPMIPYHEIVERRRQEELKCFRRYLADSGTLRMSCQDVQTYWEGRVEDGQSTSRGGFPRGPHGDSR